MKLGNRLKKIEANLSGKNSGFCECFGQAYEMRRTDLTGNLETSATAQEIVCPTCGKPTEHNKAILILPSKMTAEEWTANTNLQKEN